MGLLRTGGSAARFSGPEFLLFVPHFSNFSVCSPQWEKPMHMPETQAWIYSKGDRLLSPVSFH